jgi:hypothetical protein
MDYLLKPLYDLKIPVRPKDAKLEPERPLGYAFPIPQELSNTHNKTPLESLERPKNEL